MTEALRTFLLYCEEKNWDTAPAECSCCHFYHPHTESLWKLWEKSYG